MSASCDQFAIIFQSGKKGLSKLERVWHSLSIMERTKMEDMETSQAISALEAKRSAEAQMARAMSCPPWRHGVFGLLMGGLIASPAFALPIRFGLLAVLLCLIPVIVQSDRKRTGMFVSGYRRGKTRGVTFAILIVELLLYGLAVHRALDLQDRVSPLILGLVGILVGTAGSVLWQRVFVREMNA